VCNTNGDNKGFSFLSFIKFLNLPTSGAAMIMGIIIGGVFRLASMANFVHAFVFEPELFYFVSYLKICEFDNTPLMLLPPIIFESGYNMRKVSAKI
jgi:hypothetical protein